LKFGPLDTSFMPAETGKIALVPNLPVGITGRLGTKSLVVNTKWPWHLSILSWLPESPFTVHTRICAESCPRECFYKPFKRSLHD